MSEREGRERNSRASRPFCAALCLTLPSIIARFARLHVRYHVLVRCPLTVPPQLAHGGRHARGCVPEVNIDGLVLCSPGPLCLPKRRKST